MVVSQTRRAIVVAAVLIVEFLRASPTRADQQLAANGLLRKVVDNELKAQAQDHSRWMYRRKIIAPSKHEKGEEESEVIQTKDGDLDRLVSVNGRSLTQEQQVQEDERIQRLLKNSNEQRKLQRDREQDAQKSERMLKMLPQAVIASYGEHRGELVELTFKPNPRFQPSSHEGQVFHAMEGAIWVNDKQNRLAEITGRLTQEVKFGLGLLGHLDKGGQFQVKQSEVEPGYWEVTLLNIDMRGRALFFKTISVQQHEIRSEFQRVPEDLTLAQAAQRLRLQTHAAR